MAAINIIKSKNDLEKIKQEYRVGLEARRKIDNTGKPGDKSYFIQVCMGGGCLASGADKIKQALEEQTSKASLPVQTTIFQTGCLGPCALGPLVVVYPDGILYTKVKEDDIPEIVESHLKQHKIVERLLCRDRDNQPIAKITDSPFLKNQKRIVLRNSGIIDPLKIEEYIACDGYAALAKVLNSMQPEKVIEELKNSGLRGRGGAGFPTWMKWSMTRKAEGMIKYVICNADEGDPGAFMDRSVLEGDPHSLIEAMIIAGYSIGSSQGYVYVRAEYPLAVERLTKAINDARALDLLGKNILGSGFDFNMEIRMGSGAFVCGEETALMTSIEGNRGEPRPRPPFPSNEGLWGKPSLLNNVETYASIPSILLNGAAWYAAYGTEKSRGTKVFALAGAVNTTGLVEIPIGTPLGEIIHDIGGSIIGDKEFKAAQIGGPSGGCIPRSHLNVPVDYESLTELGAIMGSGGLIVMDEDTCMVDVARYFLEFVQDESCGKCVPCRVGSKRMLEILERICHGEGKEEDLDTLIELGNIIKDTALCGLGQTAANPVLSTIRYFRDEYLAHIREKRCPAGVCNALFVSPCQNGCPAGVNIPGFISLVGEKRYSEAIKLHRERNPLVGICGSVCFHFCEKKCRRASLDGALAIRNIKLFMSEQEAETIYPEIRENTDNAQKKIAIIGGGPAGLTCGYFLARLGYKPVIFEAEDKPGGMLVQAIPAYRLPRERLDREIDFIKSMGVVIKTKQKLGVQFTIQSLLEQGYDAVFLGIGATKGLLLNIKGNDAEGNVDSLEYLKEYNLKGKVKTGKNVVVIGGGNCAVDAARTALRLGAKSVNVLYRRTANLMTAYKEEVEEAVKEGIKFNFLISPDEILTNNGKVTGVKCSLMKLGDFDVSGRRKSETLANQEKIFEADQVIFAVGQLLDKEVLLNSPLEEITGKNYMKINPLTCTTSIKGIFAGGDMTRGSSSVIEAIADGEKAAAGIDEYLTGANHAFWREYVPVDTFFDPEADPVMSARADAVLLPVEKRLNNFKEVETGWPMKTAINEAKRCLRCDYRI